MATRGGGRPGVGAFFQLPTSTSLDFSATRGRDQEERKCESRPALAAVSRPKPSMRLANKIPQIACGGAHSTRLLAWKKLSAARAPATPGCPAGQRLSQGRVECQLAVVSERGCRGTQATPTGLTRRWSSGLSLPAIATLRLAEERCATGRMSQCTPSSILSSGLKDVAASSKLTARQFARPGSTPPLTMRYQQLSQGASGWHAFPPIFPSFVTHPPVTCLGRRPHFPGIHGGCLQGEVVRCFGGRAGGLKRRKRKKQGLVTQTGLGHRLEFFWPKKAKRTRVPLIQNSRPNLVFDHRLRRWLVMWYQQGVQVFRPFTCKKQAFEKARTKAILLLRQLQKSGAASSPPKPDVTRSGVRGVFFDPDERHWVAVWNQNGLRRFKSFSVSEVGFDVAYRSAVAVRRQKLNENYQFVMQRGRRRCGREPFR